MISYIAILHELLLQRDFSLLGVRGPAAPACVPVLVRRGEAAPHQNDDVGGTQSRRALLSRGCLVVVLCRPKSRLEPGTLRPGENLDSTITMTIGLLYLLLDQEGGRTYTRYAGNCSGRTCASGGAGACGPRTTAVSARCDGFTSPTGRNEATPEGATPFLTTLPERLHYGVPLFFINRGSI